MDAMNLLGGMLGAGFGRGRGPGLGTVAAGAAGVAAVGGLGYLAYKHFQGQPAGAQPGMMGGQPGQPGMMGGQPGQPGMMGAAPGAGGVGGFLQGMVGASGGMRTDGFSAPGYEWQQQGAAPQAQPAPAPWAPATSPQPRVAPPAPAPAGTWGAPQPAAWGASTPAVAAPAAAAPAAAPPIDYTKLPAMPVSPYAESSPGPAPASPAAPAAVAAAPAAPAAAVDAHAMLLVRAMVAAANADGQIDAQERADILARLEAAGVGPAERAALEKELDAPRPVTALLAEVTSKDVAEQFYAVSFLALNVDNDAERAYVKTLPLLLKLDDAAVAALHEKMGRPLPA